MKKRRYTWSAVLCLLVLFGMFGWIVSDSESVWASIREGCQENKTEDVTFLNRIIWTIDATEGALNESADRTHGFIQLFGGIQRILGKRIIEDANPETMVVRLDNGKLQFISKDAEQQDVSEEAQSLIAFNRTLEQADIPMLFMAAPSKVREGNEGLPETVKEYGNAQMTQLVTLAEENGVTVLDFRRTFDTLSDFDDYFFNTDHHWKPEGAFLAFQELCSQLEQQYGFSIDDTVTDPGQYEFTVYEDIFLGSQGKRVGTLYAGVDDITLIAPRFETHLTYRVPSQQIERTGDYRETVIFPERVETVDYFGGNPYTLYAGGDYDFAQVINHKDPDGPYVLLVRDSYACALTPFLSLACGKLETVDLRYFQDSLTEYVLENKPDIVLFLYTTATTNTPSMFQFS